MFKNLIYILTAVSFIFLYVRYIERRSIYFPMREIEITPGEVELSYEDVYFNTEDKICLNGWWISKDGAEQTVLFFHGNAGNISHRLEKILILNELDLNVFIIDYRGYGKSEGRPTENGLYKDAEGAYEYLVSKRGISSNNIILYGESLGGAVTIDLATKRDVRAVITECAFSSVKDIARGVYPFLPTFFIASKFDSLEKIKNIKAPKLIIHSKNDEIIPFEQSIKLFKAAPEPRKQLILTGGHNTCYIDSRDTYIQGLRSFLKTL